MKAILQILLVLQLIIVCVRWFSDLPWEIQGVELTVLLCAVIIIEKIEKLET